LKKYDDLNATHIEKMIQYVNECNDGEAHFWMSVFYGSRFGDFIVKDKKKESEIER
jgi:hypothetical protein